jgi:tRNA (guanine37-N1)-methyltransferase
MDVAVKETNLSDAFELSNIAKDTFALACPEESDVAELKAYCEKNLSPFVFEKLISAQNSYVSHAYLNNEIAGFVVLIFGSICPKLQNLKKPVELHKFYLKPKYHGKEVAKILMNDVINTCKKKGYENVWLSVFSGNKRAMDFYSKSGFVVVGQTNFIMGSETHLDNLMVAKIA